MKINSKEDIIKYFNSGCTNNLSIGVENEKFLFDIKSSKKYFNLFKKIWLARNLRRFQYNWFK